MIAKIYSAVLIGLDAKIVEVEIDIRRGLNSFHIVGLPDKAISEAKERILSAIKNSGFEFPRGSVIVNLAPANLPKSGSMYDLPIAIGVLQISNQIKNRFHEQIFIGELSLNGNIRKVTGILPILAGLLNKHYKFFIPAGNSLEATLIENIEAYGCDSFLDLVKHFQTNNKLPRIKFKEPKYDNPITNYDLKNVIGQSHAKRALEISASGGHNLLFTGVPGSGKTYLSRCITGILPRMSNIERLEVTKIYSVADRFTKTIMDTRPFRAPHTTSSDISLIGGGRIPKPGEVTLAHRGVLFLDEFPEFSNKSLETLRQPLEDKFVTVSRAAGSVEYPADFILLAAMNPCRCGFLGDPDHECICSGAESSRYKRRISGPIMDRIDLQVVVPKVKIGKLIRHKEEEKSSFVRNRVEVARKIQTERYHTPTLLNSGINNTQIRENIKLSKSSLALLKAAVDSLDLSARGYFKILKVSRTIADLERSDKVKESHIAEALSYRM